MKKFLNKSLFYQGDKSILIPLLFIYLIAYLGIKFCFQELVMSLYDNLYRVGEYSYIPFPYNFPMVLGSALYLSLIFVMVSGFFKRKKWTALLAGPFTRKDIRVREVMIMILSILVFVGLFLLVSVEAYFVNKDVFYYFGEYFNIMSFELIRMTVMLLTYTAYIFFIDSLFTNVFFTAFGAITPPMLLISIVNYFSYICKYNDPIFSGAMNFLNNFTEYLININLAYFNRKFFVFFTILLVLITIILTYLSIGMVKGIKVEKCSSFTFYKNLTNVFKNIVAVAIALYFVPEITEIILYNLGNDPYDASFLSKVSISITILIALVIIINTIVKVFKLGIKKSNII